MEINSDPSQFINSQALSLDLRLFKAIIFHNLQIQPTKDGAQYALSRPIIIIRSVGQYASFTAHFPYYSLRIRDLGCLYHMFQENLVNISKQRDTHRSKSTNSWCKVSYFLFQKGLTDSEKLRLENDFGHSFDKDVKILVRISRMFGLYCIYF